MTEEIKFKINAYGSEINKQDFKPIIFERFTNESGVNVFVLSHQQCIVKTNIITGGEC